MSKSVVKNNLTTLFLLTAFELNSHLLYPALLHYFHSLMGISKVIYASFARLVTTNRSKLNQNTTYTLTADYNGCTASDQVVLRQQMDYALIRLIRLYNLKMNCCSMSPTHLLQMETNTTIHSCPYLLLVTIQMIIRL